MLTETRLHEKREMKRLHRLDVLSNRQARMARLSRHQYTMKKVAKTLIEKKTVLQTLASYASKVKSWLRWSK